MAAHHVHAMDGEPSGKARHASQRPAERTGLSFITAERIEAAKLLAAGGVAGAVSKSATAPLARLTILYQVDQLASPANICCALHQHKQLAWVCSIRQPWRLRHASALLQLLPLQVRGLHLDHRPQQQSLRAAVRQIVQQEGVRALWKGNGVSSAFAAATQLPAGKAALAPCVLVTFAWQASPDGMTSCEPASMCPFIIHQWWRWCL